ncbi:MAG: hypothetical protein JO208_11855 [Alphaproteobacteria bacterium]|nr:hypothetical protein [Alphaproteobacteria bacterium]
MKSGGTTWLIIFGVWWAGLLILGLAGASCRLWLLNYRTEKALNDNGTVYLVPWWPWIDGMLQAEGFKYRQMAIQLSLAAITWAIVGCLLLFWWAL